MNPFAYINPICSLCYPLGGSICVNIWGTVVQRCKMSCPRECILESGETSMRTWSIWLPLSLNPTLSNFHNKTGLNPVGMKACRSSNHSLPFLKAQRTHRKCSRVLLVSLFHEYQLYRSNSLARKLRRGTTPYAFSVSP